MNCFRLAALALATSGIAFPQLQPDPGRVYEIQGRVVDADSGRAIPMARVQVSHTAPRPAVNAGGVIVGGSTQPEKSDNRLLVTDASGAFRLSNVPAGYISLNCSKTGYLSPDHPRNSHTSLSLGTSKETAVSTTLYLSRHGVIHGTVLDERGVGPSGGSVQALRLDVVNGRRVPRSAGNSGIHPDGSFRIMGLKPGRYYTVFIPNGAPLPAKPGHPPRVLRTTFFPASHDLAGARMLSVQSGEEQYVEFRPVSEPGFQISGRVATESGNFSVSVSPASSVFDEGSRHPVGSTSYNTDEKTFQAIGLPSGAYRVTASIWQGDVSRIVTKRLEVNGGDLSGLVLEPAPSNEAAVSFRYETPPPTQKNAEMPRPYVKLQSESQSLYFREDKDGNLSLGGNQSPGVYALISPYGEYYVKSARQGGRDALREGVLIPEEGAPEALDITLGERLQGAGPEVQADLGVLTQTDSIHVAYFRKSPVGLLLQGHTMVSPQAVPGGFSHMMPLAPGDYVLMSWTGSGQIEQLAYNEPGFRDRYNSVIEPFTIGDSGGRQRIVVRKLLPAAAFEDR